MLLCKECGGQFAFTARDQQFYAEKGFQNEPQRCRDCRLARKGQTAGAAGMPRANFEAICAECGTTTTVPFRPRGDRPVYCRTCFTSRVPVAVG
ncbi:MAG TPA: zinc-ribbon domain containing protein [Candidatus Baltobacteraceae bacterium]